MREKFLLFLIPLIALMAGAAHFQTSESSTENRSKTDSSIPAEEKPFWESAQKFLDAYTARDAKALGMMFTDDAEFRDEFGERTVGREAITALFADVFGTSPEAILEAIDIERILCIDKHVALEEGWVSARDTADGPLHFSRYVALHTLGEDGVWRINTLKDYPREAHGKNEHLDQLEWLVGDWINEEGDSVVKTSCKWSDDGNYLLRQYEVHTANGKEMDGVQRIGWDPQRRQIRSWSFDSEGGFRTGFWTRNESQWLVTSQGTTADGQALQGTAVYTIADPERIVWTVANLVIGDEIMPEPHSVILVRSAPTPQSASSN